MSQVFAEERPSTNPRRTAHCLIALSLSGILLGFAGVGCSQKSGGVESKEFVTTESGLQYRVRRQGGGKKPQGRVLVKVHYRDWLDDGTVFESSFEGGDPVVMMLPSTIAGWQEGLPYCAEGGAIELIIPPELGYGEEGSDKIPANATLHFLVEVIEVITG